MSAVPSGQISTDGISLSAQRSLLASVPRRFGTRTRAKLTERAYVYEGLARPRHRELLRSAIEAVIGHMKIDGHRGRCYLKAARGMPAQPRPRLAEDPV